MQIQQGRLKPIAFASRTLTPRERIYATNERETLACVWACEHWTMYLLGRRFTLITDHKALTSILSQHGEGRKTHKFDRWRLQLADFDYDIQHRPGVENIIPDMLSRLPQLYQPIRSIGSSGFSVKRLAEATACDKILVEVIKAVNSNKWPKKHNHITPYFTVRNCLAINNGCLLKSDKIVVPEALRRPLLIVAHKGHPGIVRAKTKLRETYWWPAMSHDIESFVRRCNGCMTSDKSRPKGRIPTDPIPKPSRPWEKIAIDVTGPFHTASFRNRFIVVAIDYYSGFPELLLSESHEAKRIITWLSELFARYGNPEVIVTDNAPEFTSEHFLEFLKGRDIQHHRTPVYHPQTNGKVEAFNRTIKFHAQTFAHNPIDFKTGMEELLERFRAERPSPEVLSPSELMFGRRPRLAFEPNGFQQRRSDTPRESNTTTNAKRENINHRTSQSWNSSLGVRKFNIGDNVRVRRPSNLIRKGESPFSSILTVKEILGLYTYKLSDGQVWNAANIRLAEPQVPPYEIAVSHPLRRSRRKTRPPKRYVP